MSFECLKYEILEKVALITVNRPEKLNALNIKTLKELFELFTLIKQEKKIRCVVITGAGEKAFIAGADINEISLLTKETALEFSKYGQQIFDLIETLGKPVIAAINGFALGGGCELALSCHIRLASSNAKFGQPEINLALIPGYGGTQRLTRIINHARAIELIITGDLIDAEEAYRIGLVNKVYAHQDLVIKALEMAKKISLKSSLPVKFVLNAVLSYEETSLQTGITKEAEMFAECCGTKDFTEGTSAFLEKRKPVFKNE
ncbi:MAG: enoyl-CoA hydratase-related protein [bacterium]